MSVFDLSKELFKALVTFRENAPTDKAMDAGALRDELLEIFRVMDLAAQQDVSISPVYDTVREALAVFTDGMILESGWLWARVWRGQGIERYLYGRELGSRRFMELAGDLDQQPDDVAAIFYVCLALGYTGGFSVDAPELLTLKKKLAHRLPAGGPGGSPYHQPRPGAPPLPKPGNAGVGEPATSQPLKEKPTPAEPRQKSRLKVGWTAWAGGGLALLLVLSFGLWLTLGPEATAPGGSAGPGVRHKAGASAKEAKAGNTEMASKAKAGGKTEAPKKASPGQTAPSPQKQTKTPKAAPPEPGPQKPSRRVWGGVVQSTPAASKPEPAPADRTEKHAQEAEVVNPPVKSKAAKPDSGVKARKKPPAAGTKRAAHKKPRAQKAAWRLRAGVFVGPLQSGRLAKNLSEAGLAARVEKKQRSAGKHWYVVYVGPLESQDRVREVAAMMKKRFNIKPIVQKLEP